MTSAAQLYKEACEGGSMRGCVYMGAAYQSGQGVTMDVDRAYKLYTAGCEATEALGCANLGAMYESGVAVPKDPAVAASLFLRALRFEPNLKSAQDGLARVTGAQ